MYPDVSGVNATWKRIKRSLDDSYSVILCGVGFRFPAEMHRIHHTNSFLVFCLHTAADGALKTTRTSVPVTLSCVVLSSPHLSHLILSIMLNFSRI